MTRPGLEPVTSAAPTQVPPVHAQTPAVVADAAPSPAQVDQLANTADVLSEEQQFKGLLNVVGHSFLWLNDAAQQKLETLRQHLKKEDAPPWHLAVLEAALDVAMLAGAAAGGEFLAAKWLLRGAKEGVQESVKHEFIKGLLEEGVNTGIAAGKHKLSASDRSETIDAFVDSQKEAVRAGQMHNQTDFLTRGSFRVKTVEEARALTEVCSQPNVEQAAVKQYQATRDAWVSYLAQQKYGAIGSRGHVQRGDVHVGSTTTNMTKQENRERTNKVAPGLVPEDAPVLRDAILGDAPGVLFVFAKLPSIVMTQMAGKPSVTGAILNGVNETIRNSYAKQPLAELQVPRQLICDVDGFAPSFSLNLNEKATGDYLPHAQAEWLRARANVQRGDTSPADPWKLQQEGLELLLNELILGSVVDKP